MKRLRRDGPLVALDAEIVLASYLIALVLRFDASVPPSYWQRFRLFALFVVVVHIAVNHFLGLYGRVWEHASVSEARSLGLAGLSAAAIVIGGDLVGQLVTDRGVYPMPLSVVILGASLSLLGFGAVRFYSRLFARRRRIAAQSKGARVLVVGAGSAGAMIIRDLQRSPSLAMRPVAAVDDDQRKTGRSLHGVPVVGDRNTIPSIVQDLDVDQVLLAIPSATSQIVREIAELCEKAAVSLRVLPSVKELIGDRVTVRDIRDVRIEDLLGRQQVEIDTDQVAALLADKRVLITGAGGSIGSEIARQVTSFRPHAIALLDHDESLLHEITIDIPDARAMLADIRDRERMQSLFADFGPQVVFHAAAHKHVPILEAHPEEAFLTNVVGTANVVDAAVAAATDRFVLISTDKAVNPINVMGASKRLAEQVLWSRNGERCRFCAVRFGNVLGSRGSVIPTFFRQIERGGPVTVTDPEMTRYFMSVEEAVQLVLQAAALSENGEVFTLDMGEPVNILDLARKLIRLSGRVPNKDVSIAITGTRPGEGLTEDMLDMGEQRLPSSHPAILVSQPSFSDVVPLDGLIDTVRVRGSDGMADLLSMASDYIRSLPQKQPSRPGADRT